MTSFAIVKDGVVINRIEAGQEFADSHAASLGATATSDPDAQIGCTLIEGVWTQPSEPEPDINEVRARMIVSRFQARAALHQAGLLTDVQALMDDPATDPIAVIAWQDATEFRRLSPTVATIAAALELSDQDLDDLFIAAAAIRA